MTLQMVQRYDREANLYFLAIDMKLQMIEGYNKEATFYKFLKVLLSDCSWKYQFTVH